MKILLIGGGSGGHITPLLAVAHELKVLDPQVEIAAVCEKGSRFAYLYEDSLDISTLHQIPAGKYRRYAGYSLLQKAADVKTLAQNGRDVFRTLRGYRQALKLLKHEKPDILLIKGGFVGVPIGLAAARLDIPFITHDSDSTPGLANRIISRWAKLHATGMPAALYAYPKEHTVYTGIPVSADFKPVSREMRREYRDKLGLGTCTHVITVVGGSQGGEQLNKDMVATVSRLAEDYNGLGVLHIAGEHKLQATADAYDAKLSTEVRDRVMVAGFVDNVYMYQGAADIVVSRAGATQMAELAQQALPVVVVPGRLAGAHQDKNASYFAAKKAVLMAPYGDADALYEALRSFLEDERLRYEYASNLHRNAKPHAAGELAALLIKTVRDV